MLPYLTTDTPGIGGVIKHTPEDFFVQEIPLYEPSGQGEHVFCEIEKTGLTTFAAIDRLADVLKVHPRDIGYAGMKDAQALTRQWLSIPGVKLEQVMHINLPGLKVLFADYHGNKLRLGHLAGNRFAIRIRDVDPMSVVKVQPLAARLQSEGMPNYFGEQRFGRRGDNHLLGAALIRGDDKGVLDLLLGHPKEKMDDAQAIGARKAFDRGDLEQAMRLFPRNNGMERRVLARFIKTSNPTAAVKCIDEKIRRLWVSALQSEMFNQVVAARIGSLNRIISGDLAWKHDSGAVFKVEDPASEQARCDAFEISPSGPLVGYRMTLPAGEALAIEQQAFASMGLAPDNFRMEGRHKIKGARRAMRVQPKDLTLASGVDNKGGYVTISFQLPPGSFATVLLREIMKNDEL